MPIRAREWREFPWKNDRSACFTLLECILELSQELEKEDNINDMNLNLPISPVYFRYDFHLQFERLVLGECGTQQFTATLQQWQHHLAQILEFVRFVLGLWMRMHNDYGKFNEAAVLAVVCKNSQTICRTTYHIKAFPYFGPFAQHLCAFGYNRIDFR